MQKVIEKSVMKKAQGNASYQSYQVYFKVAVFDSPNVRTLQWVSGKQIKSGQNRKIIIQNGNRMSLSPVQILENPKREDSMLRIIHKMKARPIRIYCIQIIIIKINKFQKSQANKKFFANLQIESLQVSKISLYLNNYPQQMQFTSRRPQSQASNLNLESFDKSFSVKYPNFSSVKAPQQISWKVKLMVQQANRMISRLLYNLKYLYQTNGIRYQVEYYQNVIMRILVPHQLLSHFHIVDNYQVFWVNSEEKQNLIKCKYQKKYRKIKNNNSFQDKQKFERPKIKNDQWYQKTSKRSKKSSKNQNIKNLTLNSEENSQIKQYSSQSDCNLNDQNKKVSYGSRPLLGVDVEKKLVLWIIEQLASKRGVKLRQIAKQAKQLASNVKGFKSSRGWVSRFFYRHPYLKQMIKQSKAGNYQMIKIMYFKIRDKLFNDSLQQSDPGGEKIEQNHHQIHSQQSIQSSYQQTVNQDMIKVEQNNTYDKRLERKRDDDSEQRKIDNQSYDGDIYQQSNYSRYGGNYREGALDQNENQNNKKKKKLKQRTKSIT